MPDRGNPNIAEAGKATRIKPGQKLPGAGRRPNRLRWLDKKQKYSSQDIEDVIAVTEQMRLDELKKIAADKNKDLCVRTIAKFRIRAYLKEDVGAMANSLWSRAYGAPRQRIENINTDVPFADLPEEDRDQVIEDLINKYKPMEEKNESTE